MLNDVVKYSNPLAGLVDEKCALFICPFIIDISPSANFPIYIKGTGYNQFIEGKFQTTNVDIANGFFVYDNTIDFGATNTVPDEVKAIKTPFSVDFIFKTIGAFSGTPGIFGTFRTTTTNTYMYLTAGGKIRFSVANAPTPSLFKNVEVDYVLSPATIYSITFGMNNAGVPFCFINGDAKSCVFTSGFAGAFNYTTTDGIFFGQVGTNTLKNTNLNLGDFRISDDTRSLQEHILFTNVCLTSRLNNFSI